MIKQVGYSQITWYVFLIIYSEILNITEVETGIVLRFTASLNTAES